MTLTSATKQEDSMPTVALVGRVNVGKSTLFNVITGKYSAIVTDIEGTTRTSNRAIAYWRGQPIRFIDTGGMVAPADDPFAEDVIHQVNLAIEQADVIVFVIDVRAPLDHDDKRMALKLQASEKPVILAANKADTMQLITEVHQQKWRGLGFGDPEPVSASTGKGVGDLLDLIYDQLDVSETPTQELPEDTVKIALIGKPNVGKSSLFNELIGEDAVIVSDIPHTTRETFDTLVSWEGHHFLFIDTAGIRKKSRVGKGIEQKGVSQSINQIKEADVILFVLDSSQPISSQDKHLAGLIEDSKKPIIIVANKWDLTSEGHEDFSFLRITDKSQKYNDAREHYLQYITRIFKFVRFAPIVYLSALTGRHVLRLFPMIEKIDHERKKWLDPVELEEAFEKIKRKHLPTKGKGVRHPQIFSIKQIAISPPVFELKLKAKTDLHETYLRYLQRQIRRVFGFEGVPMVFYIKK